MAEPMSDERLAEIKEHPASSDVPGLVDEVKRLRAELAEIHTTETDVTWLANGVQRIIEGVSVRTAENPADARAMIGQEAVSLIRAGILTAFVTSRVVDLSVARIKQAEVELDELKNAARTVVLAGHRTARQQFIVDLTRLGVLSRNETRQALRLLDAEDAKETSQ